MIKTSQTVLQFSRSEVVLAIIEYFSLPDYAAIVLPNNLGNSLDEFCKASWATTVQDLDGRQ